MTTDLLPLETPTTAPSTEPQNSWESLGTVMAQEVTAFPVWTLCFAVLTWAMQQAAACSAPKVVGFGATGPDWPSYSRLAGRDVFGRRERCWG